MNLVTIACEYCGKRVEKAAWEIKETKHNFCSQRCNTKWQWENGGPMAIKRAMNAEKTRKILERNRRRQMNRERRMARAWITYERMLEENMEEGEWHGKKIKHFGCYIREARAMLEGKNWEGKNRCVKLEGDEE